MLCVIRNIFLDTYLQLYRLTVDDGTMKALGDSIPMRSEGDYDEC